MGVFDSLVTAADPKHHRRYPSSHDIRRHEGSAAARNPWNPPQHRAKHEHAAAIVHLAEHVPDKTLAAHLLHYAFPTTVPKPSAPLTDQLLVSLADHLDQAIHHVSHPTRPAIVSGAVRAAMADHPARPKTIIRENPRLAAAAKHSAKEVTSGFKPGTTATASVNGGGAGVARTNAGRAARGKGPNLGHSPGPKLAAKLGPELRKGLGENPWIAGLEGASLALPIGEGATALKEALGAGGAALAEKIGLLGRAAEGTRAGKAVGGAVKAATTRAGESTVGKAAVAAARRTAPVARPAGTALKYGAKHPVQGSTLGVTAAQVPAFATTGDPSQLLKGLEGTGVANQILGGAGNVAAGAIPGVAGRALSDLISLPAQVPPSLYLTGRAGVKAAAGDPTEAKQLLSQFESQDPLGALVSGHPGRALQNLSQHPVYGALEALGLKSAVGHGVYRAGRVGERARAAATGEAPRVRAHRPALHMQGEGDQAMFQDRGPYSRDAVQAALQRVMDTRARRKRGSGPVTQDIIGRDQQSIRASTSQYRRYKKRAVDQFQYGREQIRRGHMALTEQELKAISKGAGDSKDIMRHMVERIARNPETAAQDLRAYRDNLLSARNDLARIAKDSSQHPDERAWAKIELKANKTTIKNIEKGLTSMDPQAMAAASDQYVRLMAPLQQELEARGLINPAQGEKAAVIPYARQHMGSGYGLSNADRALYEDTKNRMNEARVAGNTDEEHRLFGQLGRIRAREQHLTHQGEPLSTEQIHAHMEQQGVPMREGGRPEAGFVTQRMGSRGRSAFLRKGLERPRISAKKRTGEATTKGTSDPTFEALAENARAAQSTVDAAHTWDATLKRFGFTKPNGSDFESPADARLWAEHQQERGVHFREEMIPVRRTPWLAKREELVAAAKHGKGPQAEAAKLELNHFDQMMQAEDPESAQLALADWLDQKGLNTSTPGDTVLMPASDWKRMQEHFQSKTGLEKSAEALTGMFKGAILPTSPGWATGNVIDNYLVRMLGTGLTPLMARAGGPKGFQRIMHEEMTPEQAQMAIESITPGGLYGHVRRVQPFRDLTQFEGHWSHPFWRAAHEVRQMPIGRRVGDLYSRYRDWIFHIDGRYVEQIPQYAELARTGQHDLDMTRRQWRAAVKAGDPAVRALARGLRNQDSQIRYARRVEATFGNWGKNSPEARRFLTTWAPFWMWSRAALKFVYATLPKDHPILTGLLAASESMTREERQKLGLDFQAKKPVPDYVQGSIPNPVAPGLLKVGNLSSFGYAADIPGNMARVAAPQFMPLVMSLAGLDWKGDKIVRADGGPASELDLGRVALTTTGESFLPFLNLGQQIGAHGALGALPTKPYDPSTVGFLRSLHNMQDIPVPISKGGSSSPSTSSNPWSSSGSAPSSNPWSTSSSSSSANPWKP